MEHQSAASCSSHETFYRTWKSFGLQPLSQTGSVLKLDPVTSDVTLEPLDDEFVTSQSIVFEDGRFWNKFLMKVLSFNAGKVIADTNDTRGASLWTLGT